MGFVAAAGGGLEAGVCLGVLDFFTESEGRGGRITGFRGVEAVFALPVVDALTPCCKEGLLSRVAPKPFVYRNEEQMH